MFEFDRYGFVKTKNELDFILWLLWLCDGKRGLYEIEKKSYSKFPEIDKS